MGEIFMNNRNICKAKRKDTDEWIEGYYVCLNRKRHLIYTGYAEIDSGEYYPDYHEVIPKTVVRCTGLEDKNGNLIFDGDVVKADRYIFFVKFGKCGGIANDENYGYMGFYLDGFDDTTKNFLRQGLRDDICYFTDVKVIGNIHDNAELLKGGDME